MPQHFGRSRNNQSRGKGDQREDLEQDDVSELGSERLLARLVPYRLLRDHSPDAATDDGEAGLDIELQAAYARNKAEIDAGVARKNAEAESFQSPSTPAYVIGKALYPGVIDEDALKAAVALARGA